MPGLHRRLRLTIARKQTFRAACRMPRMPTASREQCRLIVSIGNDLRSSVAQERKIRMLASQRALFDIPRDVCYLNAASYSPLPLQTLEAGRAAVARKGRPWLIDNEFAAQPYDRTRKAAAALINAAPEDVALIASVGYGVSTAAKVFAVPTGSRVLVLQDDHSSAVLEWQTRAAASGFSVETVRRPENGDWTQALLTAIERPGSAPIALASISSVHWSDGGAIDLGRVAPALRDRGAALLVDATHSAGVLDLDVQKLDPDFLVFPTYNWLLRAYARVFRHGRARSFHLHGNGGDRHGDDGAMGLGGHRRAAYHAHPPACRRAKRSRRYHFRCAGVRTANFEPGLSERYAAGFGFAGCLR